MFSDEHEIFRRTIRSALRRDRSYFSASYQRNCPVRGGYRKEALGEILDAWRVFNYFWRREDGQVWGKFLDFIFTRREKLSNFSLPIFLLGNTLSQTINV